MCHRENLLRRCSQQPAPFRVSLRLMSYSWLALTVAASLLGEAFPAIAAVKAAAAPGDAGIPSVCPTTDQRSSILGAKASNCGLATWAHLVLPFIINDIQIITLAL